MNFRDVVVIGAIAGAAWFGYRRSHATPPARTPPAAAEAKAPAGPPTVEVVVAQKEAAPAEQRDDVAIRMRLEDGERGTYIRDILAQQEQMLVRWPEKRLNELRVWIEPTSSVRNWNPQFPRMAERAFDEWLRAGFPIQFVFQPDSTGAALQIRWTNALHEGGRQIGITRKTRDQNGWIVRAEIEVATHDGLGHALTPETVGGVARHEIGHALGLGHSSSKDDVMYPESTTPTISARDIATLRLLYQLPPGVVK